MATAERRGLLVWDRQHERYEVTRLGESKLAPYSCPQLEAAMPPTESKPYRSARHPSATIAAFVAGAACMCFATWIFGGSAETTGPASVPLSTGSPASGASSAVALASKQVAKLPATPPDHPTTAALAPIGPEPQLQDESENPQAAAREAVKTEGGAVKPAPAQDAGKQHQVPAAGHHSATKPSPRSERTRRIGDVRRAVAAARASGPGTAAPKGATEGRYAKTRPAAAARAPRPGTAAPKRATERRYAKTRRARAYAYDQRYRSRRQDVDREPIASKYPGSLYDTRAPLGFGRLSREPPPLFAPNGPGPYALGWLFR
jgi:hypothetical protein